jgi:hypothetical protein
MQMLLLAVLALAPAARTTRGPAVLGRLRPRLSSEIASSKWSIGAETMDRNLTVWSDYDSYLPPLGAKRARLQCGWGRCDRTGNGAPYNWAWLDEPVFGLAAMGVKPWLELSYGNSHYAGGGTNGPGASVPNSTVALTAWAGWVTAVAERYANVTDGKRKRLVLSTCSGQAQRKLLKKRNAVCCMQSSSCGMSRLSARPTTCPTQRWPTGRAARCTPRE